MKQSITRLMLLVFVLQWLVGLVAGRIVWSGSDYLLIATTQLIAIFLPTVYYINHSKRELISIQPKGKIWLIIPAVVIAVGMNLLCQYINLPVLILLEKMGFSIGNGAIGDTSGKFEILLNIFFVCMVPALFEELLFRGVALNEYKRLYGKRTAIIVTSLIFAIMHFDATAFFPQLLMGAVCGYMMIRTGNLILPIFIHLSNNLFSLAVAYQSDWFSKIAQLHPVLVPIFAFAMVVLGVGFVCRRKKT